MTDGVELTWIKPPLPEHVSRAFDEALFEYQIEIIQIIVPLIAERERDGGAALSFAEEGSA